MYAAVRRSRPRLYCIAVFMMFWNGGNRTVDYFFNYNQGLLHKILRHSPTFFPDHNMGFPDKRIIPCNSSLTFWIHVASQDATLPTTVDSASQVMLRRCSKIHSRNWGLVQESTTRLIHHLFYVILINSHQIWPSLSSVVWVEKWHVNRLALWGKKMALPAPR